MSQSIEQGRTSTNSSEPVLEERLEESRRTNAVRMSIPKDPTGEPTISINLGEPGASEILHNMTGVELQVIDGMRYVCLQNGIKVVPFPVMRIDGFSNKGIDMIFPPDNKVGAALRTGCLYKKEKAGESVPRSCVSFIIPKQYDADIVAEFVLGREIGDKIHKELFA